MSTTQEHTDTVQALQQIESFEAHYGYDASYMKEMLDRHPQSLAVFNGFVPMAGFREKAALEDYFTAKITAFQHADCGPCLQLAARMAQEAGVSKERLREILHGSDSLPARQALIQRFTHATLQNSPDCEALREEVEATIGKAAAVELALVIAAAQVFAIVKRALGYYKSCQQVSVDA